MVFANRRNVDRKTSFQATLGSVMDFLGVNRVDDANPLAPRMSPEKRRSTAAERPVDIWEVGTRRPLSAKLNHMLDTFFETFD